MVRKKRALIAAALVSMSAAATAYNYHASRAAASVWPRLTEVGFWEAMLAGHAMNWVFHRLPLVTGVALFVSYTVLLYAVLSLVLR